MDEGALSAQSSRHAQRAAGLTPHGLRHSHKTLMDELGVPPKLMDERMGHDDGSVQAGYSHVTAEMRRRLLDDLTRVWQSALEARRRLHPGSPVAVLDRLLRQVKATSLQDRLPEVSQGDRQTNARPDSAGGDRP
jgi:Phage integrase family